jgi:transcriptional regulator with XRE-family HTH domain
VPRKTKRVELSRMDLGARLRALRLAQGMTQAEVAQAIGTHYTVVSAVERGLRALTLQQLIRLNAALDLPTNALLEQEPPRQLSRREGRLLRRVQRIQELPVPQQRIVLALLEALLKTHGQGRRKNRL